MNFSVCMNVALKTFGCRLNRAESLDLESRLEASGYNIVELSGCESEPDVILVRGCSVTARARHDCEKEIEHLRTKFPFARIVIGGCLPNAADLSEAMPMSENAGTVPMKTSRAYLKVQDGCSGSCTFCIVPQFRGMPKSEPFGKVLAKARAFLDAGYREIVVTGCNLALYRSEGRGLPELLAAIAELGTVPEHRVRLGSLEPGICDDRLLETVAKHTNICRFIHVSLQSAANSVLERMKRPYKINAVAHLQKRAFELLGPFVTLGADVITGFPGETEAEFQETFDFIAEGEIKWTNLHVFPYSERPGTPAAVMPGGVPREVRVSRARMLEKRGQSLRSDFARTFIGRTVEVCVERGGDHGWTGEYLPCKLSDSFERRNLVSVKVSHVDGATLFGTPINAG